MADPRNIQKNALIQASVCGMTVNKFSRVPGSSVRIADRLIHARGTYQVNQSGRTSVRVALTSNTNMMRNKATGTCDCGAKKNALQGSNTRLRLNSNAP